MAEKILLTGIVVSGSLQLNMEYTKQEIANHISRPVGTIKHWTDLGVVKPEVAPARGKGYARLYSFKNLLEFAMVDYMAVDMGMDLKTITLCLDFLNKERSAFYMLTEFGKDEDLVFCFEITNNIESPKNFHENISFDDDSGEMFGGDFLAEAIEKAFKEENDVSGWSMLKLGHIRNRAMKKHNITWRSAGVEGWGFPHIRG